MAKVLDLEKLRQRPKNEAIRCLTADPRLPREFIGGKMIVGIIGPYAYRNVGDDYSILGYLPCDDCHLLFADVPEGIPGIARRTALRNALTYTAVRLDEGQMRVVGEALFDLPDGGDYAGQDTRDFFTGLAHDAYIISKSDTVIIFCDMLDKRRYEDALYLANEQCANVLTVNLWVRDMRHG